MRRLRIALAVAMTAIAFTLLAGRAAFAMDNCPTSNDINCIDVGQTAQIRITNGLLQTFCVDSQGHPDNELVTVEISGEPTTGGASATLDRDVFRAYSEYATLFIHTTTATRPGSYHIAINGTGTRCGRYHGYEWFLGVRPKITGPDSIYGFNGARPPGYPTQLKLTALPAGLPHYDWFAPANIFRFPNNRNFIRTTTNTVKVLGIGATRSNNRVGVYVATPTYVSLVHEIRVRQPTSLEFDGPPNHLSDGRFGYRSIFHYILLDQYDDPFPNAPQLPVSIFWAGPQQKLFATTNWERPSLGPKFLASPGDIRIQVFPQTDGGSPATDGIPRAQHPRGGAQKIDCWKASIFVGGDRTHNGVKVDQQNWVRFRDHATTEATSCP